MFRTAPRCVQRRPGVGRSHVYSSAVPAGDRRVCRRPPQRIDEDPDRAPGRADGLDFPAGEPVVDRPAAHVDELARPHDRDVLSGNGHRVGRHRHHRVYRHRVVDATASTYTGTVSDALAVAVDCYAGSRGEETPRRFRLGDQLIEIEAVVERWRTPDHRLATRSFREQSQLRPDGP